MLSKVVDESQKDWDRHLGSVAIAYNSAEHENTGFTPYFLEYGREMRLPTDFTLLPGPERDSSHTIYEGQVRERLVTAFHAARTNLHFARQRQKA